MKSFALVVLAITLVAADVSEVISKDQDIILEPVQLDLLKDTQTGQLDATHADYQAPYQYEKPQVTVDYEAPLAIAAPVPVVRIDAQEPAVAVQNDYLPPFVNARDAVAKRHVRYFIRRRV
ncbi:uncharacterized protein LOC129746313 [Uranotaenia lowii]|uniref:uncharacterized protein LOC129746313 n=1 Tax=Uranotaenia lowii TaxID=190385 RepID=UPI0024796C72|nr:uncharacterized protein LOC129746313 [Uranotaenia lowii]